MTLKFETGEQWLHGGVPVIWVAGELDLATRERVAPRLTELAGSESALIVDLRRCTFIDSSAIALLTQLHRDLSSRNGSTPTLAVVVDTGDVSRMLQLAGLDRIVPILADPDAALAALKRPEGLGA